jgi:hypothetical protein
VCVFLTHSSALSLQVKDALNECTAHIHSIGRQARVRAGANDAARRLAADPAAKALSDGTSPETLGLALLGLWGDYLEYRPHSIITLLSTDQLCIGILYCSVPAADHCCRSRYLLACDAAEQEIAEVVEEGVDACKVHSVEAAAVLRQRQLHWVCANSGMAAGRQLYRQLMRNGERVTTGRLGLKFLRACIALEMEACAAEGKHPRDAMEPVRWLFEAVVRLDGA